MGLSWFIHITIWTGLEFHTMVQVQVPGVPQPRSAWAQEGLEGVWHGAVERCAGAMRVVYVGCPPIRILIWATKIRWFLMVINCWLNMIEWDNGNIVRISWNAMNHIWYGHYMDKWITWMNHNDLIAPLEWWHPHWSQPELFQFRMRMTIIVIDDNIYGK